MLTGFERNGVERVPPLVSHFDGLVGLGLASHGVPLLVRVLYNLADVLRVESVHDVEKIFTVGHTPLSHLFREVLHERRVVLEHRPQVAHGEFVVQRDIDPADLVKSKQRLFIGEHFLEEIFVDHVLRRNVKLHCSSVSSVRKSHLQFSLK